MAKLFHSKKAKAAAVGVTIILPLCILLLTASLFATTTPAAGAGATSQDFYGWRLSARTPAYPNWPGDWVKGDLGPAKTWREFDWVSYVLVLSGYGGTTLPAIDIRFDFYTGAGKDAIFVDLVRYFSYKARDPYGGTPDDVTPANFATWRDGAFTPTVINSPYPEGTADSQTNPPKFAFWRLTPNPALTTSPVPTGKSVVIYFEAHLAPTFVWSTGEEFKYHDNPTTNAWGGDRYDGWTVPHLGSGYTSGSSPHFTLVSTSIGAKTVPIPIPVQPGGAISGTKYLDLNANGVRDGADEIGLGGWEIDLETVIEGITFTRTATTADDGTYAFTGLAEATYTIKEVLKDGWTQTGPKDKTPPFTYTYSLSLNEIATGFDFGNVLYGDIKGYKYDDMAGDGPGGTDVAIDGWAITLWKGSTNLGTVYTGAGDWPDGYYEFLDLLPGDYKVVEEDRVGWTHTSPSFVDVSLSAGETETADFYNFKNIKISGYKWNDLDGDGTWDTGEVGLGDWTIELYKWDVTKWVFQTSTTTSSNMANLGYYEFTDLGPGRYKVNEVDKLKWVQSFPANDGYYDITVTSGTDVSNRNFGNFHPKIQLTVCTTYDSDGESVTFMMTVTNPLPSVPGVTVTTLTGVTVTSTLPAIPTIGPVDLPAGGSATLVAPFTYIFQPGDPATFAVTFTATGLDADGDAVTVAITVTVVQP